jgi:exopolyphosphatase/guanosine-5'-triphosphate,3'-diphosphate pyrophosphatase
MKVAALDLGSNTFLCLIAEVENGQIKKIIHDEVEIVRLGQGLSQNKRFHPDALTRAEKTLDKFSRIISHHRPDAVLAMATSAARDAENKDDLFALGKKYNIPIEIIPGEKEAEITYSGSISGLGPSNENLMVLDIGGGSTEFIFGQGPRLLKGKSLDIGCVRLTEKFIKEQPTPAEQISNVVSEVDKGIYEIKKLMPENYVIGNIVAVAGTPTTLAAAHISKFDPEKIDGFMFSKDDLKSWLNRLTHSSVEDKVKMGIPEGRADVILIGVIILLRVLEIFNIPNLMVSTRGVRYGVALEVARRFNS